MLRDLFLLSPLHLTALTGVVAMLAATAPSRGTRAWLARLTATGLLTALAVVVVLWGKDDLALTHPAMLSTIAWGPATLFVWAILLLIGAVVALSAADHLPEQGMDHGEFYALLAFSVVGMMAMVAAREFFTLFIGLEIMSMAVYVLCGFKRSSVFAAEASLKYFILGSFGSAVMLIGIAFAYGAAGSTEIADLGTIISSGVVTMHGHQALAIVALVLLLAGFAFKVAAVPFHGWTPDVYEGAPTPVTGLMAAGVKTAAVVAFARVFLTAFSSTEGGALLLDWPDLIAKIAAVTIIFGNLAALNQLNIKRMLGYSAIAHAGYLLIAIAAMPAALAAGHTDLGGSLLYYVLAYSLANLAAFGVLGLFAARGREDVDAFLISGAARRHPVLAVVLALAMISLAGIPPTAGFFSKFYLLREVLAVRPDLLWLVIVAVLGSAASAYYYLRPIVRMYMHEESERPPVIRSGAAWLALGVCAALLLHAGVQPGRYVEAGRVAAADLSLDVVEVETAQR